MKKNTKRIQHLILETKLDYEYLPRDYNPTPKEAEYRNLIRTANRDPSDKETLKKIQLWICDWLDRNGIPKTVKEVVVLDDKAESEITNERIELLRLIEEHLKGNEK